MSTGYPVDETGNKYRTYERQELDAKLTVY